MIKSIIKIFIIMMFVTILFNNFSMAIDFDAADNFITKGADQNPIKDDLSEIGAEFAAIGNVLKYIGAGIIVGATGYMGILYMVSAPEKQAKLKEQLIGLVVSAVIIFGAYYIWEIIVTALDSIMA